MEEKVDINNCQDIDILRKEAVRVRAILETIMQKRKKSRHDYYIKNADKIKLYNKEYYYKYPDRVLQNRKKWVAKNQEKYKITQKKWYDNNKERLKEYQSAYRERRKLEKQPSVSEVVS